MNHRFGPLLRSDGVLFRLWAPNRETVALALPDQPQQPMAPAADGFFECLVPGVGAGQRYGFVVADQLVPDPASRLQDTDAAGWSVVQAAVSGRRRSATTPWSNAILCEIHVGTATPEGSFAALQARLPYYRDAGFTVVELLPVADFAGARGWGYDGVLPFAPDRAYGSPEDLRALIDRAHELGLGIMLDVVYNHFGPSGNFLHLYAEAFFSDKAKTPWGSAIDLDNPLVRSFFVENVRMWIEDYGFDGLRFDAVHAFLPGGGDLLLAEIAAAARAIDPGVHLVLENDDNAARWLRRRDGTHSDAYTAQWNDDLHHALHSLATGEVDGYYVDYTPDTLGFLERGLREGFIYQGEASPHREGRNRGERSAGLHPAAFVAFLQNHDQIGNRAFGDRLTTLAAEPVQRLLQFLLMLSPQIPLLFMGEEYGATTPFLFFCDFEGELADAVREGRAREFSAFTNFGEGRTGELPDPLAFETFERSKLDQQERLSASGQAALARFRELAGLRRRHIAPLLASPFLGAETRRQGTLLLCRWRFERGSYALAFNASDAPAVLATGEGILDEGLKKPAEMKVGSVEAATGAEAGGLTMGAWSGAFWPGVAA